MVLRTEKSFARVGAASACDSDKEQAVFFGGNRSDAAFAYHPVLRKSFLFGGRDSDSELNDVWSFDGSSWKREDTTGAPSPRAFSQFAYDPNFGKLILFGGESGGGNNKTLFNETFAFDGKTWTEIKLNVAPQAVTEFVFTYDVRNSSLLLFGGMALNTAIDEQWSLRFASAINPPEVCLEASDDTDGDGLSGCADPDCWYICDPTCPPGASCPDDRPTCGDQRVNEALETRNNCPADFPPQ